MKTTSLLLLLGACAAAPHPTPPAPSTRYVLQPMTTPGPEGRHSAWHSTDHVEGALELRGDRVSLTLAGASQLSPVQCPEGMRDGTMTTMQACAEPGALPRTTATHTELTGDARWSGDVFTATLAGADHPRALRCAPSPWGLACTLDGRALAFADATPRSFALAPTPLADGAVVYGALEVHGLDARLAMVLDGRPELVRAGHVEGVPGGVLLAFGGPVGRVQLVCHDPAPALACDLSVDPEAFGRPATWGPVTLAPGAATR